MNKKRIKYSARLDSLLTNEIYLNINLLKEGSYHLKIVENNKVIKQIVFEKHKQPK